MYCAYAFTGADGAEDEEESADEESDGLLDEDEESDEFDEDTEDDELSDDEFVKSEEFDSSADDEKGGEEWFALSEHACNATTVVSTDKVARKAANALVFFIFFIMVKFLF